MSNLSVESHKNKKLKLIQGGLIEQRKPSIYEMLMYINKWGDIKSKEIIDVIIERCYEITRRTILCKG